jgi:hypothetical protein
MSDPMPEPDVFDEDVDPSTDTDGTPYPTDPPLEG